MRSVLLYVVLVGLPLLGVLGTLHVGERITPPAHIGGTWRVASGGACAFGEGAVLVLSQSGEHVAAEVPGRGAARGSFRGGRLVVEAGPTGRTAPGCADDALHVEAAVGEPEPARLRGSVAACAACPRVPFEAVREAAPTAAAPSAH